MKKKGQILVEILIALGIGTVTIVSFFGAVSYAYQVNTYNKQKFIATVFAQDALEKVRNIRDTNLNTTGNNFKDKIDDGNGRLSFLGGETNFLKSPVKTGIYIGNGQADQNISGLGFQPDLVIVGRKKSGCSSCNIIFRTKDMDPSVSYTFNDNGKTTNGIISLESDGFKVGDGNVANDNNIEYFYFATQETEAKDVVVGKYQSDGTVGRLVDMGTNSFHPNFVLVQKKDNVSSVWRIEHGDGSSESNADGESMVISASNAYEPNRILDFTDNGFTIGSNQSVNENTKTYYYFAFSENSYFRVGQYSGSDPNVVNHDVGFFPDMILIKRNASYSSAIGEGGFEYILKMNEEPVQNDPIFNYLSDGFEILGKSDEINRPTGTFSYAAWSSVPLNVNIIPESWELNSIPIGEYDSDNDEGQIRYININPIDDEHFEVQVTVTWKNGEHKVELKEILTDWKR